jgi:hypothetical protein
VLRSTGKHLISHIENSDFLASAYAYMLESRNPHGSRLEIYEACHKILCNMLLNGKNRSIQTVYFKSEMENEIQTA